MFTGGHFAHQRNANWLKEEITMKDIKNVVVYGTGLMGKNIAYIMAANPAYNVIGYDIEDMDLHAAIRNNTKALVEAGAITQEEVEARLSRITFTTDINHEGIRNADLVIEAIFEVMELKQKEFVKLEGICSTDCIFTTNTSVMSPSEISKDLKYRSRFVGTHFWNPAHLIPLVEVVKTDATSDEVAQQMMVVMAEVGKKPVLCKKDVPGFIGNRMQAALWREAISIVNQGIADAATVDMAVRNSFGLRLPQLGPLENTDMIGTDLVYNIHDYVLQFLEDSHRPSPMLEQLSKAGKIGFKTGEGFQKWTPEQIQASRDGLNAYLVKMLYGK